MVELTALQDSLSEGAIQKAIDRIASGEERLSIQSQGAKDCSVVDRLSERIVVLGLLLVLKGSPG